MSDTIVKVQGLSKQYCLGKVGSRTLRHDVTKWMYKIVGKDNLNFQAVEENDRSIKGKTDYVWALKDIDFEVKQGEVLGIIGKNGAGKSTLLKVLSRVTSPTKGEIRIKGRIASLLEVGTGFHPELSGRDNVFLNGAILGMTKKEIKSKFDEIVDFAGVERYIDTPVKRYSSGMYVRLAFAVAAHLEPEILIIDEVLAVGDAEFQKKCLGKMKDVSKNQGRTVLFVSHYMPAVQNLCNHAIVLGFGKKVFDGNTEQAVNLYLDNKKADSLKEVLDRNDRKGKGFVYCSGISILDDKFQRVEFVKSGDEINIQMRFKIRRTCVHSVAFRLQIVDKNEQIFFVCNNDHTIGTFKLESEGTVICTIPKLPLFGGHYYINLTIYTPEDGVLDEIEFAKELIVSEGDFFNSGKVPAIKKGLLVTNHWRMITSVSNSIVEK